MSSRPIRAPTGARASAPERAPHARLRLEGSLWIMAGELPLGGVGRIELLERIGATGSIRQAALAMGMSYRAAWTAVQRMEQRLGLPLVHRVTGGVGGGGAELSAAARRLIERFHDIESRHRAWLEGVSAELGLAPRTGRASAPEKGGGAGRRPGQRPRG
jgi:molybdate transport system regulatory protein